METELNVCDLPPRERHPKIFTVWESIPVGGVLRLVNDHDPKPLYYLFQAEREGEFEWTCMEQGPERWAVAIRRVAAGKPGAPIPPSTCGTHLPVAESPAGVRQTPTPRSDDVL